MNQQDIVNIINSSLVDYNVRWNDIKYMADKAILKINSYLGAKYPPMSEVLQSPEHTYTVRINNKDLPIFPEKYIHTVVIPFIQSEVLAKDEEFTTIYNKYVMDYDNGLFEMMSNEYNRIPKPFRQDVDSGVFFTNDGYAPTFGKHNHPHHPHHPYHPYHPHHPHHSHHEIPRFECSVKYHINNPNIKMTTQFTNDIIKYPYGAEVKVLNCVSDPQLKAVDGYERCFFDINTDCILYRFAGWSYNERTQEIAFKPGEAWGDITVRGDVNLYAVWKEESIFDNNAGTIFVKNEDIARCVTNLVIPENVNEYPVYAIDTRFDKDMSNLVSVTLPKTVNIISSLAFTQSSLVNIIFPEYNYLFNAPNINLAEGAIYMPTPNKLRALYLPYSIRNISASGINVGTNYLEIYCEVPESDKPDGWAEGWYTATEYNNVKVVWGVANG